MKRRPRRASAELLPASLAVVSARPCCSGSRLLPAGRRGRTGRTREGPGGHWPNEPRELVRIAFVPRGIARKRRTADDSEFGGLLRARCFDSAPRLHHSPPPPHSPSTNKSAAQTTFYGVYRTAPRAKGLEREHDADVECFADPEPLGPLPQIREYPQSLTVEE